MKNNIILVTGGARSGKSSFAENLIGSDCQNKTYIATCPAFDEEMRQRIKIHREQRRNNGWVTIEEQYDLVRALADASGNVLIDCLTLWINNLLYQNKDFNEAMMVERTKNLLVALKKYPGQVVLVINEVGLGLVPENSLGRLFRDCSGRCGQMIAHESDEVYWMVCGLSQRLK